MMRRFQHPEKSGPKPATAGWLESASSPSSVIAAAGWWGAHRLCEISRFFTSLLRGVPRSEEGPCHPQSPLVRCDDISHIETIWFATAGWPGRGLGRPGRRATRGKGSDATTGNPAIVISSPRHPRRGLGHPAEMVGRRRLVPPYD